MTHFFISYAKKDTRELALALSDALNTLDGVTAWVDQSSLIVGLSWELQIQAEIDRCDYMIVLYSPDINRHRNGQKKSYMLTEIAYAQYTANKRIIPIMAQSTTPPISLTMEHYINYTVPGMTLADLVDKICSVAEITIDIESSRTDIPPRRIENDAADSVPPRHAVESDQRESLWEGAGGEVGVRAIAAATIEGLRVNAAFTGKHNRDWKPFIATFDDLKIPDMPFCLVPPGSFLMGSDDGRDNEKPQHQQTITQPYWIAQYPVTNAQWKLGVQAKAVGEPQGSIGLEWYKNSEMANVPVVGINWFAARNFAEWLGCRLPSELEWEYAARGVESWVYPWGNEWKPDFCVWRDNSGGKPADVRSKPQGASWVGACHLSGNVWEWTMSRHQPYLYNYNDSREVDIVTKKDVWRVVRGGSWFDVSDSVRSAYRFDFNPGSRGDFAGFRLCRPVE